ncbi:hypothetical protein D9611_012490 [Ephemerocybe angulata]|uniref:CID domain-containing protein n=1 Tax=Ephemerocybe angulata TaxID=980116 RepID=A0A8H5CDA7_9AGAR|nr:hypothetical protein D9611_012490 [Tulosesus angulatus]
MSGVEQFESLLKELVLAKRLSGTKLTKLTEIAMQCIEHDTQLVSILYRLHKSLPSSNKVSSLYVFDALARAAKSLVNKRGDEPGPVGNAASFLAKLGGVVDGLYQDMQNASIPEGKEKSKKVLDIWIKGSTFPPDVLSRLGGILKGADKGTTPPVNVPHVKAPEPEIMPPPMSPTHTSQTPPQVTPPVPPHAPVPATPDAQATLLALLAQVTNAGSAAVPTFPQTSVNTPGAQFAAAQYVLQQLAQTAAPALNVASTPIISAPTGNDFTAARRSHMTPVDHRPVKQVDRNAILVQRMAEPRMIVTLLLTIDRSLTVEALWEVVLETGAMADDSDAGTIPVTGIGNRLIKTETIKEIQETGAHCPVDVGAVVDLAVLRRRGHTGTETGAMKSPTAAPVAPEEIPPAGKDEFGRDIRSPSPERGPNDAPSDGTPNIPPHTNIPASASPPLDPRLRLRQTVDISDREPSNTSVSNIRDSADVAPSTSASSSLQSSAFPSSSTAAAATTLSADVSKGSLAAAEAGPTSVEGQGLDKFDFSTFDMTSPTSWEALGKMWQVTYGIMPAGEQLMQFVVSGGTMRPEVGQADAVGMAQQQVQQQQVRQQVPQQVQSFISGDEEKLEYGGGYSGRGRGGGGRGWRGGYGGGRGRGGGGGGYNNGYGNARMGQNNSWGYDDQGTDAIVLGGGDESPVNYSQNYQQDQYSVGMDNGSHMSPQSAGGGGNSGKMQRVGDKWVFTRLELNLPVTIEVNIQGSGLRGSDLAEGGFRARVWPEDMVAYPSGQYANGTANNHIFLVVTLKTSSIRVSATCSAQMRGITVKTRRANRLETILGDLRV